MKYRTEPYRFTNPLVRWALKRGILDRQVHRSALHFLMRREYSQAGRSRLHSIIRTIVLAPGELALFTIYMSLDERRNEVRVERAPGSTILNLLAKLLPKKFHKAVIEPTVSDMQDEYVDALAAGNKWHRRWIWWRGHFSVLLALLVGAKVGIIKKFVDVWKVL